MKSELFCRIIGSEPGFEKSKVIQKSRTAGFTEDLPGYVAKQPVNVLAEPVLVPEIRQGVIVGWRPF